MAAAPLAQGARRLRSVEIRQHPRRGKLLVIRYPGTSQVGSNSIVCRSAFRYSGLRLEPQDNPLGSTTARWEARQIRNRRCSRLRPAAGIGSSFGGCGLRGTHAPSPTSRPSLNITTKSVKIATRSAKPLPDSLLFPMRTSGQKCVWSICSLRWPFSCCVSVPTPS